MPDVLQGPLDARIAPGRILFRHPHRQAPNLRQHSTTAWATSCVRPLPGDELTMPAKQRVRRDDGRDLRNRPRPSRDARTASRRRSASVSCRRRPRSWRRSTRFSSSRYRRTSRSSRSSHPVRSVSSNWNAEMSITAGVYITGAPNRGRRTSIQSPPANIFAICRHGCFLRHRERCQRSTQHEIRLRRR